MHSIRLPTFGVKADYILDTSTVSYFIKGNGRIVDRVMELPPDQTAITAITIAEVYFGLLKFGNKLSEDEKTDIRMTIDSFNCLDIEASVAYRHAHLKAAAGMHTCKSDNDLWLAAYCDHHGSMLITADSKLAHLQNFTGAIEILHV